MMGSSLNWPWGQSCRGAGASRSPGPPTTSLGDFWDVPHPTVLCWGVRASCGDWQWLSYIPAVLVPCAGGKRTRGAPKPLVRVQEGPGVQPGTVPAVWGWGQGEGTAARLLLCWIPRNDPVLSIHWRARGCCSHRNFLALTVSVGPPETLPTWKVKPVWCCHPMLWPGCSCRWLRWPHTSLCLGAAAQGCSDPERTTAPGQQPCDSGGEQCWK